MSQKNQRKTIANQFTSAVARIAFTCFFMTRDPFGNDWGLPLVVIGKPGIGKTTGVHDAARACAWWAEIFPVGERGEGELGTVPATGQLDDGTTVMDFPGPRWLHERLRDADGDAAGIIGIDELNSCPIHLQPALMGAILDKRFGGARAGGRVRLIGMMNPIGHATDGQQIAAPTANRFAHIQDSGPDAGSWTRWNAAWLTGNPAGIQTVDPRAEEARVLEELPEAYSWASAMVNGFILARPEFLHRQPPDGSPEASGPWPSHRTCHFATLALAACRIHGLSETDTDTLLAAYVGTEWAAAFIEWLATQDLPNPADLLDGKVTWQHDPARFDRTIAVISACTSLVTPESAASRDARADALWQILADVGKTAKDLTVDSAHDLCIAGLHKSPIGQKVMRSLVKIATAAEGVAEGR